MLPTIKRIPSQEFASAMFSVNTINKILSLPHKTQAQIDALKNNVVHLQSVVDLTIWTTEDLSPLTTAITQAKDWLEQDLPAVEAVESEPEVPSEYPWGNRQPTLQELDDYLVILRNIKNKEVNALRLAANNSFFMFKNKKIACDPLSRSDIDGANGHILLTGSLPPYWPGAWKTMDNSYVAIPDKQTWVEFYSAMYTQELMNFSKAQQLKEQIENASSIEAIRAITW